MPTDGPVHLQRGPVSDHHQHGEQIPSLPIGAPRQQWVGARADLPAEDHNQINELYSLRAHQLCLRSYRSYHQLVYQVE